MRATAKEFAELEGMSIDTVKRYCKKGFFEYHKVGPRYSIDVSQAQKALKKMDRDRLEQGQKKIQKIVPVRRPSPQAYNFREKLALARKGIFS